MIVSYMHCVFETGLGVIKGPKLQKIRVGISERRESKFCNP